LDLEEGKELEWLRIISGRPIAVDEKWCACFIDWQTASGRVNCTKLTKTQKDWYRLARKRIDLQTVERSKC
jgi:hypothetical protein